MVFNKVKLAIAGVLVTVVLGTLALGYRHYTGLLAERAALQADNIRLETAVETQHETIDAQAAAIDEWDQAQRALIARMEELERVQRDATAETRRLNELFSDHDLTDLARERPGLIAPRITDGAARANRLLECATGAGGADCPD